MIRLSHNVVLERHNFLLNTIYQYGYAYLVLYDGPIPSSTLDEPEGNVICTATTSGGYVPVTEVAESVIPFEDALVNIDSTPTFARLTTGGGTPIMDISVGDALSSEPLKYTVAEFYEGGLLKITSLVLRTA